MTTQASARATTIASDCDCGAATEGKWADKHAPECATFQQVLYVPFLRDPLKKGATYIPERETGRVRKGELIADIMSGQITDVARVIASGVAARECWDATGEVADAVFNLCVMDGEIPEFLVSYLEDNIAMNELAPYLRNRLAA